MKNVKRILALICVVILVGMYVATAVLAVLDSSKTMAMFRGCLILTIFIPTVAYLYMCLHRYAMYRSKRSDPYSTPSPSRGDSGGSDKKQS